MGQGLWYVLWVAVVEPWELFEHLGRPRRLSKQILHMYWDDVGDPCGCDEVFAANPQERQ
jgi:hypothetical protein